MKKYFLNMLLIFVIILTASLQINAQQPEPATDSTATTNTSTNSAASASYNFGFQFDISRPTIKLFGGAGRTSYNEPMYPGELNSTYSFAIELGTTKRQNYLTPLLFKDIFSFEKIREVSKSSSVIEEVRFSGFFFNLQFDDIFTTTATCVDVPPSPLPNYYSPRNKLGTSYALGFSSFEGASYKSADIALLNGGGVFWTKLDFEHSPEVISDEPVSSPLPIEPRIADGIRFAKKYVAEISLSVLPSKITINAGVARSVINERFLFWKWCGSMLIKDVSDRFLDNFLSQIRESSPLAYPVVSFVLRGALDFGFTELQKKKMNWPFNSAAGYIYDEFRVGFGLEF